MLRLLTLSALVATAALAVASAQGRPPRDADVEAGVFMETNAFRAQNGLSEVTPNAVLAGEAQAFADYLARSGAFSHTADGREPGQRAQAAGYRYCTLAENIAYEQDSLGFRTDRLIQLFVSGWEGSPGHRRNMLNPDVTEMGVGLAKAPGVDEKYVAVQVFGRPLALRRRFRIENRTGTPQAYAFEGGSHAIPPRTAVIYSSCGSPDLEFDPEAVRGRSRYQIEPNAAYILAPTPDGVRVEVMRRLSSESSGRPDPDPS